MLRNRDGEPNYAIYVLIALVVLLVGLPLAVAQYNNWLGWQLEPMERTGVDNVKREADWFHENSAFLRSQYANIGVLQREIAAMGNPDNLYGPKKDLYLQKNQALSTAQIAYNNACGQYQAAHDNFFHGSVAPKNVPKDCKLAVELPG